MKNDESEKELMNYTREPFFLVLETEKISRRGESSCYQ